MDEVTISLFQNEPSMHREGIVADGEKARNPATQRRELWFRADEARRGETERGAARHFETRSMDSRTSGGTGFQPALRQAGSLSPPAHLAPRNACSTNAPTRATPRSASGTMPAKKCQTWIIPS